MCNLSDGLEERITKRVTAKVTARVTEDVTKSVTRQMDQKYIPGMYENGCSLDQIAAVAGMNVKTVKTVIKNAQPVLA